MALFKKKKPDDDGQASGPGDNGKGEAGAFTPQPEKARKWFEHARTAALSSNHDYALSCYANGIRLDPDTLSAHEEMQKVAMQYAAAGGKAAAGREIRGFDDGTAVGKFAAAEFAWMKDLNNGAMGLKAIEAANKADQHGFAAWAAPVVLNFLRRAKKPSKTQFVTAKDAFADAGAWNEAITAGEIAMQLDPNDSELANELKDLSAQRAMDQGGYGETAGEEGGYRKFIKDADKQRELEEEEALSGAVGADERNLLRAKIAYEETPELPDVINRYGQLLRKTATPETLQLAYEIYMKGFTDVGEYRFRMSAGDIRILEARQRVKVIEERIQSNGESSELTQQRQEARTALLDLESDEFRERVQKYPTDRQLKFALGVVEYQLERYDQAMECFQKAKDEPRLRVRARHMLGRCFARESWHSDAIPEFREALQALDPGEDERALDIRYDLMLSLIEHAREERSTDIAREAREICSSIARTDISFKDIRARRKEVDALVKELA